MATIELDLMKCLAGPAEGKYGMLIDYDTCSRDQDVFSIEDGTLLDQYCEGDSERSGPANHWDMPSLDDPEAPWSVFIKEAAAYIAEFPKLIALTSTPERRACARISSSIDYEIGELGGTSSPTCESPTHRFDLVTCEDKYAARVELSNGDYQLYDMRGSVLHTKAPYYYCDVMRENLPWAAFTVFTAQYVINAAVPHAIYLTRSQAWRTYIERRNDIQWEVAKLRGTTHRWPTEEIVRRTQRDAAAANLQWDDEGEIVNAWHAVAGSTHVGGLT